jgi:hypothetical protein
MGFLISSAPLKSTLSSILFTSLWEISNSSDSDYRVSKEPIYGFHPEQGEDQRDENRGAAAPRTPCIRYSSQAVGDSLIGVFWYGFCSFLSSASFFWFEILMKGRKTAAGALFGSGGGIFSGLCGPPPLMG